MAPVTGKTTPGVLLRRLVVLAGASTAAVVGSVSVLLTGPASCGQSAISLTALNPDGPGFVVMSVLLWLGSLVVLVVVFWRWTSSGASRVAWAQALSSTMFVLGWGLFGSCVPHYFMTASAPDMSCAGDDLWVFTILGGGLIFFSGVGLVLVIAFFGRLRSAENG